MSDYGDILLAVFLALGIGIGMMVWVSAPLRAVSL